MENKSENKSGTKIISTNSISFVGLVQIAFIVLKLCGVINWNWVFVLMPIIIEVGLVILIVVVASLGAIIAACIRNKKDDELKKLETEEEVK